MLIIGQIFKNYFIGQLDNETTSVLRLLYLLENVVL